MSPSDPSAPFVPEVSGESYNQVVRADGGHRSIQSRGRAGQPPLVPDCS